MTCSLRLFINGLITVSPVTTCLYTQAITRTLTFTVGASYSNIFLINLKTGTNIQNPDSVRFLNPFIVVVGPTTINTHGAITYTTVPLASASVVSST